MNFKITLAMGFAAAALSAQALAQQAATPTVLTTHPLRGGVYWVSGGVSNTGFIIGDKGVVAVDAERIPDDGKKLLAEIAKVTPKPVNTVLITHGDPDHVGGLPVFPAGAAIIAQENTRAVIQASIADPNGGPFFGPLYAPLAGLLPTHTVADREAVVLDGVRMVLMHLAPAHTSADLIIYLPAQKIVFGGDLVTTNTGRFPVIHDGGSSLGWIDSMKAMLALNADTYVSGHGPIWSKTKLRAWLQDAEKRRADVKAMVYAGKTLAEVTQALPEAQPDPRFLPYTQVVYQELSKGYPAARAPWAGLIQAPAKAP